MSYHRFPNIRDVFQSQLSAKMIENVESLDFNTRACNCRSPSGTCQYGNVCRVPIVVYKVKCKTTGKIYIGNTQQYFKNRMRGHFQDVKQIVENNVYSDSYAKHFGEQVPKGAKAPTPGMQRDLISCSILWKGDPLTAVKSFGRNSCKLCNRERMAIVKACHKDAKGLINSRSELHGACRHIPRFHRLSIKALPPVLMSAKSSKNLTMLPQLD
jgi:hypothetical protein